MAVKFAVAGTGWVASEYMKAIRDNGNGELCGVFSTDKERAGAKLAELGVECPVYTDYAEMLSDSNADAVVLCSTPDVRPEQAVLAAERGKHLILEKPLSLDRDGLELIAEAVDKSRVQTAVSFVLRWNPAFEMIKAVLNDDGLGRVFMAQIDYWHHIGSHYGQYRWSRTKRLGGSSLLSAGCHAVDALRHFAGEVTEVTAYSCSAFANSDYEFDPNVIALFKLQNGGIGKVSSSLECRTPYKFNIHLLGEKGSIMNNRIFSHKFPGQTDYATIPILLPDNGDVSFQPFALEVAEFIRALQQGGAVRCDFFDAYKTMQVCFAVDESLAAGTKVVLTHE